MNTNLPPQLEDYQVNQIGEGFDSTERTDNGHPLVTPSGRYTKSSDDTYHGRTSESMDDADPRHGHGFFIIDPSVPTP